MRNIQRNEVADGFDPYKCQILRFLPWSQLFVNTSSALQFSDIFCLLKLSLKYIWFPVQLSSLIKILSHISFQHTRSAVIQKGCTMCKLTKLLLDMLNCFMDLFQHNHCFKFRGLCE